MSEKCWFRGLALAGRCDGSLVRCHLIPKQEIKRRFPKGVTLVNGIWLAEKPKELPLDGLEHRSLHHLLNDPRVWVWGCGGNMGLSGHHGAVDGLKLRIPRVSLPSLLEEYASEYGFGPWLDRTYGPR